MEVLNTLGHGFLEKPYENALVVEFRLNGIPFKQQPRFDVIYKSLRVGEYFPPHRISLRGGVRSDRCRDQDHWPDHRFGTGTDSQLPEGHATQSRIDP